jgi:hypothetical protein
MLAFLARLSGCCGSLAAAGTGRETAAGNAHVTAMGTVKVTVSGTVKVTVSGTVSGTVPAAGTETVTATGTAAKGIALTGSGTRAAEMRVQMPAWRGLRAAAAAWTSTAATGCSVQCLLQMPLLGMLQ